jgi:D-glycero-D-manno-heptose 1,7-bisphosphate phosphatase
VNVAVFLDRDGVLNELVDRDGARASPRRLADFRLVPGAADGVRRLRAAGSRVFVVTNQPDVARGLLGAAELERMNRELVSAVGVDELMVCHHDDADGCACRKPMPGMLSALAAKWDVDLAHSFIVGDSWKDVEAGRRVGCRSVLIAGPEGDRLGADAVVQSLADAVRVIEEELRLRRREAHGVHP